MRPVLPGRFRFFFLFKSGAYLVVAQGVLTLGRRFRLGSRYRSLLRRFSCGLLRFDLAQFLIDGGEQIRIRILFRSRRLPQRGVVRRERRFSGVIIGRRLRPAERAEIVRPVFFVYGKFIAGDRRAPLALFGDILLKKSIVERKVPADRFGEFAGTFHRFVLRHRDSIHAFVKLVFHPFHSFPGGILSKRSLYLSYKPSANRRRPDHSLFKASSTICSAFDAATVRLYSRLPSPPRPVFNSRTVVPFALSSAA